MSPAQRPADSLEAMFLALRPALEYILAAPLGAAQRISLAAKQHVDQAKALRSVVDDPSLGQILDSLVPLLESYAEQNAEGRVAVAQGSLALVVQGLDRCAGNPATATSASPEIAYRRSAADVSAGLEALRQPVQFLKGVGPRRAEELRRMGIGTVEDVLFHLPFRYEDRRRVVPIARAVIGESANFVGELVSLDERTIGRARRRILEGVLRDETGLLALTWFNQVSFFGSRYKRGQKVSAFGSIESDQAGGKRMVHPELEPVGSNQGIAIYSVYAKPGNLSVKAMRKIVHQAVAVAAKDVPSVLPPEITGPAGITDQETALREVHRPSATIDAEALANFCSLGHRSLVFDELFFLQLGLGMRRRRMARERGYSMQPDGPLTGAFERMLPFTMTGAQQRVIREITDDMMQPQPMHRLVQGDVGSGKTVVALHAALVAVQSGMQAAFMAPTELLAEQHFQTIEQFTSGLDVRAELLTGSRTSSQKRDLYEALGQGEIQIAVGTHALIQDAVTIPQLGLGIIDEQHRFGVLQRAALRNLGGESVDAPDVLLMTATPIPRTLSMTVYGDLDVSLLDELPPGRKPVATHLVHEAERGRAYATVRREVESGRQAYIVYPLVESSEKIDLRDATTMARELNRTVFPDFKVGLMHGKMKADEKDAVMRRFRAGDVQILVTTTVVEVGVDVPNATVMVVEHAERFGLSQLHQLRGRVGRGADRAYCILVSTRHAANSDTDRLAVMCDTNDGFAISEADLRLRGPGEFLGTRQSGLPDFRVSNLLRDTSLLVAARSAAIRWLDSDPDLSKPDSEAIRSVLAHRWAGRLGLAEVG